MEITEFCKMAKSFSLGRNDEGNCSYLRSSFCKQKHMLEMQVINTHILVINPHTEMVFINGDPLPNLPLKSLSMPQN